MYAGSRGRVNAGFGLRGPIGFLVLLGDRSGYGRTAMPRRDPDDRAGPGERAAFGQVPAEAVNGRRGRVDPDLDHGRTVGAERCVQRASEIARALDLEGFAAKAS